MTGHPMPPMPATSEPVRFPPVSRDVLANGLAVLTVPRATVPSLVAMLVFRHGTASDPQSLPGLASLTADLLDEGAGPHNAIGLAEAFAAAGAALRIDVAPDATILTVAGLARSLDHVMDLLADVVLRPHLAADALARVRDLRLSRLRRLSRSAEAMADRAFVSAVFPGHPYGHGAVGTSASLEAMTLEDARGFWARAFTPTSATLIAGGDVVPADVVSAARRAFGSWDRPEADLDTLSSPTGRSDPRILLVDRPGAPQSELRIGHIGPPRQTDAYHALSVVNAVLGGQFTSRINQRLREEKGVTYGARTAFDFRRVSGTFSCETNVQPDATADAVADILTEFNAIRERGTVGAEELALAKASLTRGYVRHFETAAQLVRALGRLVTYSLDADTFDQFVPGVEAVTAADVGDAASMFILPAATTVVVVGDAAVCQTPLESLGRTVAAVAPAF